MKNKKNIIIISIISAALIVLMIIIALFAGCSKNTSTPDEATADTATSDTAATIETTLNIEAQAITDNGLSIDKDGNVIDKDGKKVEPSEDGKVKIKTDDGKTVEVSADDIKKADSKNSTDNNGSSSSSSKTNQSTSSKSDNSGSSSSGSSSKSDTPKQDDGKTYHEAVYKTVHHEAVTEQVWVVDEAAYTYEEPVYETHDRTICNVCGADITNNRVEHSRNHALNDEGGGYHNECIQVQVGTKTVNVPEQGHYETKTIKESYDEKVIVKEAGWY